MEFGAAAALVVLGAYGSLGAIAAVWMHVRGLASIDRATADAPVLFRVLITPGLVALWPMLLLRWRRVARGVSADAYTNRPVSAALLRRLHGIAVRVLAVTLPVALGVAVVARQPEPTVATSPLAMEPAALATVVVDDPDAFGALPIGLTVRTADGSAQVELHVARELERAALGLYWSPGEQQVSLKEAVYLGSVWGPGVRRYALPENALAGGGELSIYSFIDAESIAAVRVEPAGA